MDKPFRVALLATAIPPTLLVIPAIVYILLDKELSGVKPNIADICLVVSFGLAAAAILSSIVFTIKRKREIAKGTRFGGGIGLVVVLIVFVVVSVLYG